MTKPKPNFPMHGAIWARRLVEELEARGIDKNMLVGNSGIDLSGLDRDEPVLPFDQVAELFERAALITKDDLLGLHSGVSREIRRAGLVAYLSISSQTVADMLITLARYIRVISDTALIDVSDLRTTGKFSWQYSVPVGVQRGQFVEFNAVALIADMRRLTGIDFVPTKVTFKHLRKNNRAALERFFGCRVEFSEQENALWLKQATLDLALRTADNQLLELLSGFAEERLASMPSQRPETVLRVEDAIARRLSQGVATHDQVARDLGMSKRTLSRRLAEDGASFAKVLETYRAERAKTFLAKSDLAVMEIAFILGYADVSTFTTAFKRWTGQTPAAFRRGSELPGGH